MIGSKLQSEQHLDNHYITPYLITIGNKPFIFLPTTYCNNYIYILTNVKMPEKKDLEKGGDFVDILSAKEIYQKRIEKTKKDEEEALMIENQKMEKIENDYKKLKQEIVDQVLDLNSKFPIDIRLHELSCGLDTPNVEYNEIKSISYKIDGLNKYENLSIKYLREIKQILGDKGYKVNFIRRFCDWESIGNFIQIDL